MSEPFGSEYANVYDVVYGEKDYPGECDLLEALWGRHAQRDVRRVLDLGSGTGGHAGRLSERGYEVVGVERSEAMLALARTKVDGVKFVQGDIRHFELPDEAPFDAAVMMFAVLGYQISDDDVRAALRCARDHVRLGGTLIFDVWHGPAVLAIRPSTRTKELTQGDSTIVRSGSAELDEDAHVASVTMNTTEKHGDRVTGESSETHSMRYFFREELEKFLGDAGFSLVHLAGFPEGEADASSWNVVGVGVAE